MTDTIRAYCDRNPINRDRVDHRTATKERPVSVGWAWKPDDITRKALARGKRKIKKAKEDTTMATTKATSVKKGSTKKAPAKKVAKKVAAKSSGNRMTLKELLGKKMDPKLARRKLRAAELTGHDEQARWEFTPAQAKKAREVLGL